MKKIILTIIILLLFSITFYYREDITVFYLQHFTDINKNVTLETKNEYYRDYNYEYVQNINNFNISNYNDLVNVYFSVINSGSEKFSFYCPDKYKDCIDDVISIANDQSVIANINSFVHPFNSFKSIKTNCDSLGKITITIEKVYTDTQIYEINKEIDKIINKNLKNMNNKKEIIKIIHDYIINNSKYDSDKSDKNINNYFSSIAYGPLLQGYGLCSGYTDAMAIFLDRYDIPNFKVISENHVWNAIYIDGEWLHLDLTWDDPVVSDGSNVLEYNFFLINNKELEELETNQHVFNKEVFSELK